MEASKNIQSLSYVKLSLLLPKAGYIKAIIHNYVQEISDYYVWFSFYEYLLEPNMID